MRCDPSLPFEPRLPTTGEPGSQRKVAIARPELRRAVPRADAGRRAACSSRCGAVWPQRRLDAVYATIDERARRVSHAAFLRDWRAARCISARRPTLWDVTFQTAVRMLSSRNDRGASDVLTGSAFGNDLRWDVSRSTRRGLSSSPRASPLCSTPDDERYRALAERVPPAPRSSASKCRSSPTRRRDPERNRLVMVARSGPDRRRVVAELQLAPAVDRTRAVSHPARPARRAADELHWRAIAGSRIPQARRTSRPSRERPAESSASRSRSSTR